MRTTSSIEAYNGKLGRVITKKGHFFKFTEALRNEEFQKSMKMEALQRSGGVASTVTRKRADLVSFD